MRACLTQKSGPADQGAVAAAQGEEARRRIEAIRQAEAAARAAEAARLAQQNQAQNGARK